MRWRGYLFAAGTLVAIAGGLRLLSVTTAGIAAPLMLLDVVIVARFWRTGPALFAAGLAAAFDAYFFLPPFGFAIADPDDWIALVAFVVTAIVAGELASRAERRATEAQEGRREIERLYQELQSAFDRASEAEAARRNEQLKVALLEALTHNLRTPLTGIKASVTALMSTGAPMAQDQRRELLQVIDEESDRLNRFIEGLSSAEHGPAAPPIHLRAVGLDGLVSTALHRADTLVRDHRVRVALPRDLPSLSVDAASITEVLYIVLDNASKYAPPGTAITIGASQFDDRYVRVSVTDEGPGIPPHLRERVFEKFFRVPGREPRDRRRGGIGLGLPIAKRLVEAQGGRVWIEAPARGGTEIVITLPVAADAPAPADRQLEGAAAK